MSTNLNSPGVSVIITDESAYDSAGPGTVPLFVFATRENKPTPAGVGIAPGTVPSMANVAYVVNSQRELLQTFGNPYFVNVEGTPVHAHELNEYGLHAAYQYLGISNQAIVVRADIDLNELAATVSEPQAPPLNNTHWFDIAASSFGVFRSTGAASLDPFVRQTVKTISYEYEMDAVTNRPADSFGEDGDFAIVTLEGTNRIFEKIPTPSGGSIWFNVGTKSWKMARSFVVGNHPVYTLTVGDKFNINSVTIEIFSTNISQVVSDINDAIIASPSLSDHSNPLSPVPHVIASHDAAGRIKFNFIKDFIEFRNVVGEPLKVMGLDEAVQHRSCKLVYAPHNRVPKDSANGDVWIKTTSINGGSDYVVRVYNESQYQFVTKDTPLFKNDVEATSNLGSTLASGSLYIQYNPEGKDDEPLAGAVIKRWDGFNWEPLSYEQGFAAPSLPPTEGTLWYNPNFRIDIMVNDGDQWLGYRNMYPSTDEQGVILSSSEPVTQNDGSPLVDHDLWCDTTDLENYPSLHRFNASTRRWVKIDNTDQTTPFGILFADARENAGPHYNGSRVDYGQYSELGSDMLKSNYVDPDTPDPRTYSLGSLLFNTRYSTYNVKEYKPNWFEEGGYDSGTDFTLESYEVGGGFWDNGGSLEPILFPPVERGSRWVTASGNKVDGSPYMGRKAQRAMIVRALASTIVANEDIRSEILYYNLIAAPGYPELIDEMVLLNTDKKEVAFILGDTPARLSPNANDLRIWATNAKNVASNGEEGLTTRNPYVGLYYPWGLTTNVDGMEVMVPPSTVALRTLAYNDQVSYPWFAPAGYTRGIVSNAASVGYLDSESEYQPVILNEAQRDTLYGLNINPFAFIPRRGLVVWGQKTLNPIDSSLDRVNVSRLTNYLRYHLDNLVKPFLFEPNDEQTRDAARITVERFLSGIVGLRGIDDFAVVCDLSNNTSERIDRNELWIDILIRPVKTVEFILVPVRLRNTGDSLVLNFNSQN